MKKNHHGLSRHIPAAIALEVRKRSKFGCVLCRCAVYQYEHIDPTFSDAARHDPDAICLLCGRCHDQVTKGRISKDTVLAKYREVQNSSNVQRPFEEFDLRSTEIELSIGTARFKRPLKIIEINGETLLSITPSPDGIGFPSLNGLFYDSSQREILRIKDNIWEAQNDACDVEVVGNRLSIRGGNDNIALRLDLFPPNRIHIAHIDMYFDHCHVISRKGELLVGHKTKNGYSYLGVSVTCNHPTVAISVDMRGRSQFVPTGVSMIGGEGIALVGTGIILGKGAPAMHIQTLKVWADR